MGTVASQITSLTIVYTTVYSGADESKHQSSASLAFAWGIHRGPVNSPHKWPVKRKMFPFDDVIMHQVLRLDWNSISEIIGQSMCSLRMISLSDYWQSPTARFVRKGKRERSGMAIMAVYRWGHQSIVISNAPRYADRLCVCSDDWPGLMGPGLPPWFWQLGPSTIFATGGTPGRAFGPWTNFLAWHWMSWGLWKWCFAGFG